MGFQDLLDNLTQQLGFEVTTFNFIMMVFFATVLLVIIVLNLLRMHKRAGSRRKITNPEHDNQGENRKNSGSFISKIVKKTLSAFSSLHKPRSYSHRNQNYTQKGRVIYANEPIREQKIEGSDAPAVSNVIAKIVREEIDRKMSEEVIPYIDEKIGIRKESPVYNNKDDTTFFQNEKPENVVAQNHENIFSDEEKNFYPKDDATKKDINTDDDIPIIEGFPELKEKSDDKVEDELSWHPKRY